jgi:hypothetical protein
MTPKEKALEIVNKFIPETRHFDEVFGWEDDLHTAKKCALISINYLIQEETNDYYFYLYVKDEINKL